MEQFAQSGSCVYVRWNLSRTGEHPDNAKHKPNLTEIFKTSR